MTNTYRVFYNNRFAGYVHAFSMYSAYEKAREQYGKNVRVELVENFHSIT